MNKHIITAAIAVVAMAATAQAQDSLQVQKSFSLNEVVVTGTRNETDVRHLSQTVSVVNRKSIEQTHLSALLPILTEQVPGLFTTARGVLGYGVSGGAAGGISLRGLGGGQGRLMVLIDGHPQYMGMFGHPISDAYQSFMTERVEVLRGPSSMLYGSNAMGGVINIVTRQMNEDDIQTGATIGYGSYNTLETEVSNRIRKGRFSSVITGSYNRSDGHRNNMTFEQYGGYAKLGYELSPIWKMRVDVNITHFNASQPGATTAHLIDAAQRVTRGMTSFAVENKSERTSGALSFFYNWGKHWINDGYNPEKGEKPLDYRFNSLDNMMGVSLYQNAAFFKGNRTTVGADYFRFGGEAWNKFLDGERKDIVDKSENEVAGYVDFRQDIHTWLTLNAGVRIDHHSCVGTEWIPQAGLSFHLPHAIEIKASASKGFRYPTIREMYMFPPQNPDLQPERMWNYELAFAQQLLDGRFSYGVNIFYIDGENLILTLPNPNGSGRLNQNSGKIYHSGFEVQTGYRISKAWSIDANYSFLHMENPVVAAPEHKLYAGASYTKGRWALSSGIQYIAGLYTSTSPETKENFALWNIRGSYQVVKGFALWLRGENLLAQRYEINAGYPMPRATVMAGLKIDF